MKLSRCVCFRALSFTPFQGREREGNEWILFCQFDGKITTTARVAQDLLRSQRIDEEEEEEKPITHSSLAQQ